jgi:hypothetical protein
MNKQHGLVVRGLDLRAGVAEEVPQRLERMVREVGPRLQRYYGYYRNPSYDLGGLLAAGPGVALTVRPYRQYQEIGLPARITGLRQGFEGSITPTGALEVQRKEVVIENDIAWRIGTLVDFTVGQMPVIHAAGAQGAKARAIERAVVGALEAQGGVRFLQQVLRLALVHGVAHVLMHEGKARGEVRLELVGAPQVVTWTSPEGRGGLGMPEYELVAVLRQVPELGRESVRPGHWLARWLAQLTQREGMGGQAVWDVDLLTPGQWQRYEGNVLTRSGEHGLGMVPMATLVNEPRWEGEMGMGLPLAGVSEVEALVPLQDELNTRLSERASRVTMTSFRMYLAKGLEDVGARTVGPGQMWATNNPEAQIETFGGEGACPGEESHIREIREALDKVSCVSPVAAGILRGRVGNLSSAVALRVTLIALLARTQSKRQMVQVFMQQVAELVLRQLDGQGVLATTPEERKLEFSWPSPLPENDLEKIQEAQGKLALGLAREVVLAELGYPPEALAGAKEEELEEVADGTGSGAGESAGTAGGESDAGGGETAGGAGAGGVGTGADAGGAEPVGA